MTRAFDFEDATVASLEYVGRFFVAGLTVIPVLIGIIGSPAAVVLVLFHNFLGMILLLPGAMLLNFALVRRFGPSRRPRTWKAAFAAVVLTWTGYGLMAYGPIPPAGILCRLAGQDWAWALHVGGWLIAASSLGLLVGWARS